MPFRPAEYRGLDDVVYDKAPCTYRPLVTAALQLVDSYFQLHAKGLCYCDISYRNICIRPTTGDILVMDNDNVTVNRYGLSGVAGTLPFMAPEVIRGETMPSRETDLYSLAVLLFGMFMRDHPMHGKKESAIRILDENAQDKLYGFEPVFMFDPRDDSNRPDPRWHAAALDLWPRYPQFFRDLFTTSFTDGVRDPDHGRVRETVWRKKLIALRDAIVYGPCGAENFYCEDYRRKHEGRLRPCWQHGDRGETVPIPFRLEVNQQLVVLNYDAKVFPHHLDERREQGSDARQKHHPGGRNRDRFRQRQGRDSALAFDSRRNCLRRYDMDRPGNRGDLGIACFAVVVISRLGGASIMNVNARNALCDMVRQYGRSVIDDPGRCKGLLHDFLRHDRPELTVLLGALTEGVPSDLVTSQSAAPPMARIAQAIGKRQKNLLLTEDAARWAVESWAVALGVVSAEMLRPDSGRGDANTANPASQVAPPAPAESTFPPRLIN